MRTINLLVAERHQLLRKFLCKMLNSYPEFNVIADTGSVTNTIELCSKLLPDIILMDTGMPGLNRFELLKFIRSGIKQPKIIALSAYNYASYSDQILGIGIVGYISKYAEKEALFQAITQVSNGNTFIQGNTLKNKLKIESEKTINRNKFLLAYKEHLFVNR